MIGQTGGKGVIGFLSIIYRGITISVDKMGINIWVYGSYGLNAILKPVANQLMVYPWEYQSVTSLLAAKVALIRWEVKFSMYF